MATFSKKHFVAVAKILSDAQARVTKMDANIRAAQIEVFKTLAHDFADEFKTANPRFDRDRFMQACGLGEVSYRDASGRIRREARAPRTAPQHSIVNGVCEKCDAGDPTSVITLADDCTG